MASYDFATCPAGFTAAGTATSWQCGVPSGGPGGDHSGDGRVWSTGLTGNSANCQDSTLTSPSLDLSAYAGFAVRLRFWHWHAFRACVGGGFFCSLPCAIEQTTFSGGVVEAFDGAQWQRIAPQAGYPGRPIDCHYVDADGGQTCQPCSLDGVRGFDGASGAWVQVEMDVSSFTHSAFRFRYHFAAYATEPVCHPNTRGWFIDDVQIVKLGPC